MIAMIISAVLLQSTPCPAELKVEFDDLKYAEHFSITDAGSTDDVPVYLTYKGTGGSWYVKIKFFPKRVGAYRGELVLTEVTSFRPTAVCRRAGMSRLFYVAGWDSINGDAVVEEWEIGPFAVASAQGGPSTTETTMTTPTIHRRNVLMRQGLVGPIRSIACNPITNELYLLESATPKILHTLDIELRAVTSSVSEMTVPGLAGKVHMNAAKGTAAGFCLVFRDYPKWHVPTKTSTRLVYVVRDTNLDGIWDVSGSLTIDNWVAQNPSGSWDPFYQ